MKKYILLLAIVLGLFIGGYLSYGNIVGAVTETIAPIYCDATGVAATSASTSVTYLGLITSAPYVTSKSCVFVTKDWNNMTVFTQMNASTTGSTLSIKPYGSFNGVDYFDIPNVTVDSAIASTIGSTTAPLSFAPQVSGFNRTTFKFDPQGYNLVKLVTTAGTASSSIWQFVVPTN